MGTTTTNNAFYKPTVGESGWGALINTNFDKLDQGVVNVIIGLATLKPAEFVIIRIQQMTRRCEE